MEERFRRIGEKWILRLTRNKLLNQQICLKEITVPSVYIYGEGNGTPLQYSCLENPMDGGVWWAVVHGVIKSLTWLRDFTLTFHFHALEKEMVTHSSVLAWRIPGVGKSGRLPSLGSQSRTPLKRLSSSSSSISWGPARLSLGPLCSAPWTAPQVAPSC